MEKIKAIKIVTGEEVIASIVKIEETKILVSNPMLVQYRYQELQDGTEVLTGIGLVKWFTLGKHNGEPTEILISNIVGISDPDERMLPGYHNAIREDNELTNQGFSHNTFNNDHEVSKEDIDKFYVHILERWDVTGLLPN